jgi:hypothetical protein
MVTRPSVKNATTAESNSEESYDRFVQNKSPLKLSFSQLNPIYTHTVILR